jgi:hypothetical protein
MLVIIAIILILTDQCAGGTDCYVSLSFPSSLLLEHSFFHSSNTHARGVQKIVHGSLPQMAVLWDATMGPRATHQVRLLVAVNEAAVQSAHCLCPSCAHSRMLVQVARITAVKCRVRVVTHMVAFGNVVS